MKEMPDYSNWVSSRLVYYPLAIGLVSTALALFSALVLIVSGICFLVSAYFAYARFEFSSSGGDVQNKIRTLVLSNLNWKGSGRVLDIGCGNGALTVMLAKKYPEATVIGVDSWGSGWSYSKDKCEENSRIEGVLDRVKFEKASASSLPFPDEQFDLVVSNLTFHEVREVRDKRELLKEALRVAKKGSRFVFQDLFMIKSVYGKPDDLAKTMKTWGLRKVEFISTRDAKFIPRALKLPFMIGTIGIIAGEK